MAQDRFDADLNIIANSDVEFQVDPLTKDLVIIQKLADEPNDQDGLTAAQLKAKFDEAGLIIKDYINNTLIQQVNGTIATEAKRVANEKQRQANEAARQSAEAERVTAETNRGSAETGRQSAETARGTAEAGRVNAENGRVDAETARVGAEDSRVSAETERADAESRRFQAEISRNLAENQRISAEKDRKSAETVRISDETARRSAETARANAESGRVSAEDARVSAENARVQAETARENAQTAFFQGVSASAAMLPPGSDATASAAPDGGSFHVSFGIPAGGPAGKSAYQYALDGGYTGTEAEFQALMAGLTNSDSRYVKSKTAHLIMDYGSFEAAFATITVVKNEFSYREYVVVDRFFGELDYKPDIDTVALLGYADLGDEDINGLDAYKVVNIIKSHVSENPGKVQGTFGAKFVFSYNGSKKELQCHVTFVDAPTTGLEQYDIVTT